jgi:hypothetical protein
MFFIDHNYMFRSPSATILRVYSITENNRKLCVAKQSQDMYFLILYTLKNVAEGDKNM